VNASWFDDQTGALGEFDAHLVVIQGSRLQFVLSDLVLHSKIPLSGGMMAMSDVTHFKGKRSSLVMLKWVTPH
jgi:hypothetical protein